MAKQSKEERNLEYRLRVQSYLISREFISSLYHEGFITEIEFHLLNLKLLMKYRISENSVFNSKKI